LGTAPFGMPLFYTAPCFNALWYCREGLAGLVKRVCKLG